MKNKQQSDKQLSQSNIDAIKIKVKFHEKTCFFFQFVTVIFFFITLTKANESINLLLIFPLVIMIASAAIAYYQSIVLGIQIAKEERQVLS